MKLQPLKKRPSYRDIVTGGLRAAALGSIAIASGLKNAEPDDAEWVERMNEVAGGLVRLYNANEPANSPAEWHWLHKVYLECLRLFAAGACDLFDGMNQAKTAIEYSAAVDRYGANQKRAWRCWGIVAKRIGTNRQDVLGNQPTVDLGNADLVA